MKKYIDVICKINSVGEAIPLSILWENGKEYVIDRIIQKCPAALPTGGAGLRYTCLINNQRRYLFQENNRWFIERNS